MKHRKCSAMFALALISAPLAGTAKAAAAAPASGPITFPQGNAAGLGRAPAAGPGPVAALDMNWQPITTTASPPGRYTHGLAYDRDRGVAVLFGGDSTGSSRLNDTWEFDGTAWRQVSPVSSPAGRANILAYDSRRRVTVLFGGLDGANSRLGDTWEYDGTAWRRATPPQSPPARDNHSMAYDGARGVVVLFGGQGNGGVLNDTWEYDGTTWKPSATAHSPPPRTEMSLAYDSRGERVVFFGGGYWAQGGLTAYGDTWAYAGASPPPPAAVFNRNVYVLVYDPALSTGQKLSAYLNWNDHATLTQGTVDFFKQVTDYRLNYTVVFTTVVVDGWPELVDGFRYTEAAYLAVLNRQSQPHTPSNVDYNKIVNSAQFDICGKLNRGEIDEVWIYNGPYFGFYESTLVGPGAYWYNSPPVPGPTDCAKLLPLMGPSPERGLDMAVHNFGHRTEATMMRVYGSWRQNRTSHGWEKFALVKALSPDYSYSGCGNIHFPPNGASDYDYANPAGAASNCGDFANYPNLGDPAAVSQTVDCSAWSCDHLGYLRYWFGRLPANAGCGPDAVANNWWRYFADPALAATPFLPCVSAHLYLPLMRR